MDLYLFKNSLTNDVVALNSSVFAASEGEIEGNSIGRLVSNLVATTEPSDHYVMNGAARSVEAFYDLGH